MKKITLSIGLALLAFFSKAQVVNGLDSIIVEKYYISNAADATTNKTEGVLPAGFVTYRVFASLHPGYSLQALFGNSASGGVHTVLISTTTTFFNNIDRGDYDVGKISSTYLNQKSLALDSWLSVGGSAQGQFGVLKSKDNGAANLIFPHSPSNMLANKDTLIGIPLSVQDGMVAGSPATITFVGDAETNATTVFGPSAQGTKTFSITNGFVSANVSHGTLVGATGPSIDSTRVLIGQFTTNGSFHFELHLQIGTPGAGVQRFVANNPQPAKTGIGNTSVPAEISLPSLTYTSLATNLGNPPTVSITAPTNAATYSVSSGGTLAITANAASASSIIDSVTFFVDGARVGVSTASPYTYNWVSTSGTHTLTAVATDDNGQQSTSSAIVTSVITGISETTTESTLSIYPNPANDVINFEINTTQQIGNVTYAIYDVIGNVLLTKSIGSISGVYKEAINVSSFSKGIYIVKITSDSLTSTKKVIID